MGPANNTHGSTSAENWHHQKFRTVTPVRVVIPDGKRCPGGAGRRDGRDQRQTARATGEALAVISSSARRRRRLSPPDDRRCRRAPVGQHEDSLQWRPARCFCRVQTLPAKGKAGRRQSRVRRTPKRRGKLFRREKSVSLPGFRHGKIIRRAGNDAVSVWFMLCCPWGLLTFVIIFRHLNVLIAKY